jgi:hypothetical protein
MQEREEEEVEALALKFSDLEIITEQRMQEIKLLIRTRDLNIDCQLVQIKRKELHL